MLRFASLALLTLTFLTAPALADEGHKDIWPYLNGGMIVSGSVEVDEVDEGNSIFTQNVNVFGADLDDTFGVGVGDAPGLFAPHDDIPEGTLDPNTTIGYNVRGPLRDWTGTEFDLVNVSSNFIVIEVGDIDEGAGLATGPFVTPDTNGSSIDALRFETNAEGELHAHGLFTLQGDNTIGSGTPATAGIYLMEIELVYGSGASLLVSDPIWIVYNFGLTEDEHELAEDWVVENLANPIPEPTSLALLGLGAVALMRRRRQHLV